MLRGGSTKEVPAPNKDADEECTFKPKMSHGLPNQSHVNGDKRNPQGVDQRIEWVADFHLDSCFAGSCHLETRTLDWKLLNSADQYAGSRVVRCSQIAPRSVQSRAGNVGESSDSALDKKANHFCVTPMTPWQKGAANPRPL